MITLNSIVKGNKVNERIEKLKTSIENVSIPEGFIKVTDQPVKALSSEQKAVLNRKGNVLFNEEKFSEASRIFITTGYSDGLTRIGDIFMKQNRSLDALRYYVLAHNNAKSAPLYEKIARILSMLIKE